MENKNNNNKSCFTLHVDVRLVLIPDTSGYFIHHVRKQSAKVVYLWKFNMGSINGTTGTASHFESQKQMQITNIPCSMLQKEIKCKEKTIKINK